MGFYFKRSGLSTVDRPDLFVDREPWARGRGFQKRKPEQRMDPECVFDEKYMEEMKAKLGKGIKKFCVLW